jgi:deoxyribodipyrimidine photo-lyase
MATHLVWLRADLRIHDNLALAAACRDPQAQVLALYIATPGQWREHHLAPRQAAFIASHLHSLHAALAERGIPLWVEEADDFTASVERLAHFCQQHQVSHLFYNYQYEFNERQRDAAVENTLSEVICQGFDDSVLLPPGSVLTGGGEMYKVFTPFKNAFIRRLREGCRRAWPRRSRARRLLAWRRCRSLTIRKRRSMGCCLPRMKNGAGAAARVLSATGGGL